MPPPVPPDPASEPGTRDLDARLDKRLDTRLDERMRRCLLAVGLTGAAFASAALLVFGAASALSVAIGAAVATGNLWVLARIVGALLPTEAAGARAQSRAGWVLVAMLKMVGLVGLLWLLMRRGGVSPLALAAGWGALPIGIAIGALVSDRNAPSALTDD
jgi:ATP synthase I chain